jgi:undecaprenyl-diphosphatase
VEEIMQTWQAIILAVVEGLTEYLPISSTGHLILTSAWMGISHDAFTKDFLIMVQFGAILAVVFEYFKVFIKSVKIYPVLVAGFLPAGIIGLAVKNKIDALLDSVWTVAIALILGGILLVFTDRIFDEAKARVKSVDKIDWKMALKIGFVQCLAFVPGVSRAAATIWGGLSQKLDRRTATEFSFLLAFPTLSGATLLKAVKAVHRIDGSQWQLLFLGNVISFAIGLITIRYFIKYVTRHGLKGFGYYRIGLGLVVAAILLMNFEIPMS